MIERNGKDPAKAANLKVGGLSVLLDQEAVTFIIKFIWVGE